MSLQNELQQLMVDYRFRPNHRLGQNFVVSEHLINKMVEEANLQKTDTVLEIGSGTGFLTRELLKKSKVVGVEIDENLLEVLRATFRGNENFTLIAGDFVHAKLPDFNKVVSLPPYNISSEVLLRVLEQGPELCILAFQREFNEKIMAEPGFSEYSYLSVLTDYLYDRKILMHSIQPKFFFPKPESYSSLLKLVRKKRAVKVKDFKKFALFMKHVFRYKNKNLSNAVENCFKQMGKRLGATPKQAVSVANKAGLGEVKTNLIATKEFVTVFRKIFEE